MGVRLTLRLTGARFVKQVQLTGGFPIEPRVSCSRANAEYLKSSALQEHGKP